MMQISYSEYNLSPKIIIKSTVQIINLTNFNHMQKLINKDYILKDFSLIPKKVSINQFRKKFKIHN